MISRVFNKLGPEASFRKNLELLRSELDDVILTVDDLTYIAKQIVEEKKTSENKVITENESGSSKPQTNAVTLLSDTLVAGQSSNDESSIQTLNDLFEAEGMSVTSATVHPDGEIPADEVASPVGGAAIHPPPASSQSVSSSAAVVPRTSSQSVSSSAAVIVSLNSSATTSSSSSRKRSAHTFHVQSLNLKDFLENAGHKGRMVIHYYNQHKRLDEQHRKTLADLILAAYLDDDSNRRLPDSDVDMIGSKILELFPQECKDEWVPYDQGKRETAVGRGILIRRYYNLRRELRKGGLLTKTENSMEVGIVINGDYNSDDDENCTWLKNNTLPWERVSQRWNDSRTKRLRKFQVGTTSINEYFDKYPALKASFGYLLLESDFDHLFPERGSNLLLNWPNFAAFVESKLPEAVKEDINDSFSNDGKKIKLLQALPYLFNVQTVARKKKKSFRPSRLEVAEAIILHVKDEKDINSTLASRLKDRYEPYGLTLSAQAIVVGQDLDCITKSLVRINGIRYTVENPRKAVDIAFKVMHALDANYPKEAEREWLFLERAVYGLNEGKTVDPSVKKLVTAFADFRRGV